MIEQLRKEKLPMPDGLLGFIYEETNYRTHPIKRSRYVDTLEIYNGKLLNKWANKKYLPLVKENKTLKEENRRLNAELQQEKLRVKQHDFERARFREMAQNYQLRIKVAKRKGLDI